MIDDTGRSDLSRVMSTHSVGYHPETSLWLDQIVVFIELTDTAFVAYPEALKGKGDSVHFATKRFSSVLCGALSGARSCYFATGSNIKVSKTKISAWSADPHLKTLSDS
jgi:hypothetical protein